MSDARNLYLDLLKRCLTNFIYQDAKYTPTEPQTGLADPEGFDAYCRNLGTHWPTAAHTMVGLQRLENLQFCIERVLADNVAGDLLEAGVWRGGTAILMRAVLKAYQVSDRRVWAADSFAGLPPPNPTQYPQDEGLSLQDNTYLAVSLKEVQRNFRRYGLLDGQVKFIVGWFRDTLPIAPIEQLAVLRCDGDLYESTMDTLEALYPKLSAGGYLIVDDYYAVAACRQAISDFRDRHSISCPMTKIDWTGVYWRRT